MDIRELTGYVAHVLLGLYWLWVVSGTAPQLRRGARDHGQRVRVFAIKTAAVVVTSLAVGVIHFWATQWWHVIAALLVSILGGVVLRRTYRRLVAAPRHRMTLAQRAHKRTARASRNDHDVPRRSHAAAAPRSSDS